MPRTMPARPEYLRATVVGRPVGVDREARVLRGYVVAQLGEFKSAGRGRFDQESLTQIVNLTNAKPAGLKSRFTHPGMSDDGLGKFLGRARGAYLGTATDARTGQPVPAVRADLHFDPSASKTPSGDLAGYIMSLAESDPDAMSSSIVVKPDRFVPDKHGKLVKLADDDEGPPDVTPLWRPRELHASDIVDQGDAVDGLLSAGIDVDGLPLSELWRGAQMLDAVFAGQSREVVAARCEEFLRKYLDRRFGDEEHTPIPPAPVAPEPTPKLDATRLKLDEMDLYLRRLTSRYKTR